MVRSSGGRFLYLQYCIPFRKTGFEKSHQFLLSGKEKKIKKPSMPSKIRYIQASRQILNKSAYETHIIHFKNAL
jgi:hypothetical protein